MYCYILQLFRSCARIIFEWETRDLDWLHLNKTMMDSIALLERASHDQQNNGFKHPHTVSLIVYF